MDTITISSRTPFSLETIRALLEKKLTVTSPNQSRLVVHHGGSRAYLYQPKTESSYHSEIHELFLDYSSMELAKVILERIADDSSLTVDNDFGTVLPGDEFVAKCRMNKGWDWRRDL
jgi:hypothetical protein